ncbi:thioredoxin [Nitrococcus mobilis]|uniref:Thioredoxin n=1 Tax=Nitrococcus mobilis Nb-231 TaxID=314278 RepID=A4BR95_9GAMM|nr:thioredoxin [Nitrococcus mobilis]EAR21717.1 thioredoxin [Nitrococcus mobilis Nb-231]
MTAVLELTDQNFHAEVLQSDRPVLIDYWAEWCAPCKAIGPIIEALAEEYAGRAKVGKLNVDDNPDTPMRYGVRSIPTLMLFKDGEIQALKIGADSKAELAQLIEAHL